MEPFLEDSAEALTHRYYTPAMLADLLGVSVANVRSWERRGLIQPVETTGNVSWFDFSQLAAARQLVTLIGQGISPAALERKLRRLSRWIQNPSLADLSLSVQGTQVVLRHGGQLLDSGGQKRLDFDDRESTNDEGGPGVIPFRSFATELAATGDLPYAGDEDFRLKQLAQQLEDNGEIKDAIEAWQTFHLACGPRAETCFRLGELLYLTGDYAAARERYYMALEMEPNRVEVRASLGCVLMELGEFELAISALRGALACHFDYPDVHYHLAGALESTGQRDEAMTHWETFLRLSPAGPWSEQARQRLSDCRAENSGAVTVES